MNRKENHRIDICALRLVIIAIALLASATAWAQSHPLKIPGAATTRVGIYVEDLKTGEAVVDINSEELYIPASVMKSITSATALSTFDPEGRFVTPVTAVGVITEDGVLEGDIVVSSVGDPTIESQHFKEYGGLPDSIAAGVKRLGIKEIQGGIIIDESRFVDATAPDGWSAGDLVYEYGTLVRGANFRDNISNGRAITDPAARMRKEIASALRSRGIMIKESAIDPDETEITDIYIHQSPRVDEILHSLMVRSDNMMAEGMLRATAGGQTRDVALKQERDLWRARGLMIDSMSINDGSGLSRKDRLSPRFASEIYRWMYEDPQMSRAYSDLFPRAGVDGTMKAFLKGTRLEGLLATKTGSMNGVQGYGGYLTDAEGNPTHTVVVFVNNFTCDRSVLRRAIANFLLEKLP